MREIIDGLGYAPKTCTWELTLACNLRCGHCGSRAGKARPGELPLDRSLEVARELGALGCRRITLSGGEPTLSPHWEAIASEAAGAGIRVNMITNGLRADRSLARRAKDAGLASVGVSIDGLEEVHDLYRGQRGLYQRILRFIDDCHAVGLPVGVVTTIQRRNRHMLDAMYELLEGRIYVWQLQIGAAMGNLLDCRREQIEPQDLLRLIPDLARLVERGGIDVRIGDNIGYYGPYEKVLRKHRSCAVDCWVGCYAGCRHVGIESDGGVKGCLSIQATQDTEGNLHHASLADIWRRKDAFAYNRQFNRSDLAGFCATCEHADICRGGCLSMRTCEGGRENPFCYHRVATLAQRARTPRRRYVPLVLAPAALLASFGLGCGNQPPASCPPPAATTQPSNPDDAGREPLVVAEYAVADPDPEPVDEYGMPEPPMTTEYAIVEPPGVDEYGMPEPPGVEEYGVEVPD
jgi:radical SAM protein with 4Fe4S-binding SPASM domain